MLSVLLCHLFAALVDARMEGVGLHHFSLLFLGLFPGRLSEEAVSLEKIEVFLQFPALRLIECELLLRRRHIALLEVDWIDVIDSDDCKQEDANVLGIYLVLFQCLVCLMDESTLKVVLSFFLNTNKSHFF